MSPREALRVVVLVGVVQNMANFHQPREFFCGNRRQEKLNFLALYSGYIIPGSLDVARFYVRLWKVDGQDTTHNAPPTTPRFCQENAYATRISPGASAIGTKTNTGDKSYPLCQRRMYPFVLDPSDYRYRDRIITLSSTKSGTIVLGISSST